MPIFICTVVYTVLCPSNVCMIFGSHLTKMHDRACIPVYLPVYLIIN